MQEWALLPGTVSFHTNAGGRGSQRIVPESGVQDLQASCTAPCTCGPAHWLAQDS